MSRTLIALATLAVLFSFHPEAVSPVAGAEQHKEFLDGLRKRGYYDFALYYLEKLDEREDLPAELDEVIPYERAITLLEGAKLINNPEVRDEQLDRAVAQLEAFTRDNPEHPLAGNANTEKARILIEKAHVKIWESESPANKDNSEKFRLEARELLTKARDTFQKAHDLHKKHYESFAKFIPKEDKERFDARQKAEIDYMRAQIDLALCTYAEAQTYEEGSQEFKNLLTKAAEEFKEIHEKYRSMVGGLYARMWQGKCFEEQDDIGKALGIYNELIAHPGKSQAMRNVQNQVLQFRLICLNHEKRKDYQLVINEAEEWLKQNRQLSGFTVGLGIRYQKAIAHEKLAEKLESDYEAALNEAKRNKEKEPVKPTDAIENHLRKAIVDAREVTKFAGQYKAPSQFMISRIKGKLGLEEGDPKTIEEALVVAEKMRQEIEELEAKVEAAGTKQEKTNAEEALTAHLNETARVLNLALKLADESTGISMLNNVRFLLCYVYYKLERNYEAGVIGEFLARHFANSPDDSDGELNKLAQKGATVARAAWYEEYKARSEEQSNLDAADRDLDFELDQMVRICKLTTELWPETGLADESRMTLGRIYSKRGEPVQSAEWFSKVTSPDKKGLAKVSAGQAYWNAYLGGTEQPEDRRPGSEELSDWQTSAKKYLADGLETMNDEVPSDATVKEATDLILARVTLAQIHIYEQAYDQAITFLTDTETYHHAPLDAVKIADDEDRPAVGVKSQNFARLVYRVLLRAYVGKQQTDDALQAMDDLEEVVGKENSEDLSTTYMQLGEQIGKEVDRIKAEGPQERLDTILASFDTFLNALYEPARRKTMSVGSLQWMAETFLNLGDSLNDKAKTKEYFDKSVACYEAIIKRGEGESPRPEWLTGMKLRLANAQRSAQKFDEALTTTVEVLKEYPDAPNVQTAAAELLQDWGFAGRPDSLDRLREAIQGRDFEGQPQENQKGIKGWGGLARQYTLMLRPVRDRLRKLRKDEEKILAYENTRKVKADREAKVESAKTLNSSAEEIQQAEADLAVITDALKATRQWVALRREREQLKSQENAGQVEQEENLERIEQINRFLNHMVDSQYYQKLESGKLREEYEKEIAKLEKKSSDEAEFRIAHLQKLLEELEIEKGTAGEVGLLDPAYRTGQRIIKLREKLAAVLQREYDQLETTSGGSAGGAASMLTDLQNQIDAVKPEGMDEERMNEVRDEIEALANEGRPVTKQQLQRDLNVLRDAVTAWRAFELVSDEYAAAEGAKPFEELELDDPLLNEMLQEKKDELAGQVAAQERKEADLHERLLEVLHHEAETRHQYATMQSSNVEKEKALRRAAQSAASVTQRVPREDISNEWWNKFNATYKDIRADLEPLLKDGETLDASADIPVPEPVSTDLTWLERPSNTSAVVRDPEDVNGGPPPEAESSSMTWPIIAVLLALAGTGGVVYLMMGSQKKKPFRVSYGAGPMGGGDEKITFPGEGGGSSSKQKSSRSRTRQKSASGGQRKSTQGQSGGESSRKTSSSGEAPRKKTAPKKRPPESGGEPPKPKPRPKPKPPE